MDDAEGDTERYGWCRGCGAARTVRVVLRSEQVAVDDDIPVGSAWPELILTERYCPACGQVG
jgi:hypothetical protein